MTEFKTDISENGKKFELVFQTDNKAYFEKMQAMARECIDNKSVTQFNRIKAMSVEEMAEYIAKNFVCGRYFGCPDCLSADYYDIKTVYDMLKSEVSE